MTPSAPLRPPLFTAAVLLHAAYGLFVLVCCGVLAALAGIGSFATTIGAIASQDEDIVPVAILLAVVALVMILCAASSLITLLLGWQAWGMKRLWIWALMIWSILYLSSGCGIVVTILTVVGGVQALEALDRRTPAP
jgi:hypothetical protein